ncbi:molybdopterin molybdotransferase MoeA [Paenibacillus xylanilyticus]|uniref:Molybdopterin molybdenumtransferase n=1 Tax=Paenibacillus xylanilyticus TaxID=248903 RepID=A0A7Y6C2L8_9BACL|nr:gephyrin-like molybdotransferase Glp [Paenibacillus xylanilyticus]NUU79424.1 molybdopterin molybdotransferase MoeA [Paenibacillus xylanilyticus]
MKINSHSDDITSPKFNRTAVQVEAAQAKISPHVTAIAIERVTLESAHGRTLAETIHAPHPYPFFRRSGMDGYAIVSSDTVNASSDQQIWLRVVDEIPCGYTSDQPIVPGTTARIMTGAQVPDGADAVVMLEMTESREQDGEQWIALKRHIQPNANITPIGLEVQEGQLLLEAGTIIQAGEQSVLATFGVAHVPVFRRPKVAIFATGTELLEVDEPLQPGRIRNSNSYMLRSLVTEAGGEPVMYGSIADDVDTARAKLAEAVEDNDIVVTTGGVSVGDYDIMGDLVREGNMEMLFNKVTMRPGSVTTAAVVNDKLLFALSGNPGACFVGFGLFVRPTIRMMQNDANPYLEEWTAILDQEYTKVNNFTRFVRGRTEIRNGRVYAMPAAARVDESSVMITIKDSDCLIIIPPEKKGIPAGEQVRILKLPHGQVK